MVQLQPAPYYIISSDFKAVINLVLAKSIVGIGSSNKYFLRVTVIYIKSICGGLWVLMEQQL